MAEKTDFKLLFCIVAVAIIWGTTYLGIRVAVETMPPWYITSLRQGIAAVMVLSILLYKKNFPGLAGSILNCKPLPLCS